MDNELEHSFYYIMTITIVLSNDFSIELCRASLLFSVSVTKTDVHNMHTYIIHMQYHNVHCTLHTYINMHTVYGQMYSPNHSKQLKVEIVKHTVANYYM